MKSAAAGEARPDIHPMGSPAEDQIPYPEEFLRPEAPKIPAGPRAAVLRQSTEPAEPLDIQRSWTRFPSTETPTSKMRPADAAKPVADEDADLTPRFQQGAKEKEAYEKVLDANATISGMVGGSDPNLRFKTWGAANRGDGLYWVRVVFTNASGTDVEYIWQVEGATGKVTPLSFNARSL
jgi:hypothetical protein